MLLDARLLLYSAPCETQSAGLKSLLEIGDKPQVSAALSSGRAPEVGTKWLQADSKFFTTPGWHTPALLISEMHCSSP